MNFPEHGVTGYQSDPTQGPACAIAAGAATIYRNYFVPIGDSHGQTARRQLDGLADLGAVSSGATELPVGDLWTMRNGYALATPTGLDAIARHLSMLTEEKKDVLRGTLRIGVHRDVEVTGAAGPDRPLASQAFCSALPVSYGEVPAAHWRPFASLVLEAAYEATLWAAVLNAQRGVSHVVFLTFLGGGVFGNPASWIHAAMRRALQLAAAFDLDVRIVSRGTPSAEMMAIAESSADRRPSPRDRLPLHHFLPPGEALALCVPAMLRRRRWRSLPPGRRCIRRTAGLMT